MKITWLGHSSFLIENKNNVKIITDPFDETVGYNIYKGNVDIVTISHDHFDHNCTKFIDKDNAKIVDSLDSVEEKGVKITSLPSFHDEVKGAKRGENIIFIIETDGYKICHLGDLGHSLNKKEIDLLGNIDLLLIPVGDNYTINGETASIIAKEINSKITIPMHYQTPQLTFSLDGVENFLTYMKKGEKINDNSIILEDYLDDNKNKVLILNI